MMDPWLICIFESATRNNAAQRATFTCFASYKGAHKARP
jgi:hypothetical protein